MTKVYSTQDTLMLGHLRNVLKVHGIDCVIRNEHLAAASGEIPPIECWPELWILDGSKYNEARVVLRRALAPLGPIEKPWMCAGCGEEIEGQFTQCWNCGASRPWRRAGANKS